MFIERAEKNERRRKQLAILKSLLWPLAHLWSLAGEEKGGCKCERQKVLAIHCLCCILTCHLLTTCCWKCGEREKHTHTHFQCTFPNTFMLTGLLYSRLRVLRWEEMPWGESPVFFSLWCFLKKLPSYIMAISAYCLNTWRNPDTCSNINPVYQLRKTTLSSAARLTLRPNLPTYTTH